MARHGGKTLLYSGYFIKGFGLVWIYQESDQDHNLPS
jgi:hypothetical protein